MSGIKVNSAAIKTFEAMKKNRTHKFLLFEIKKEKVVIMDEKTGNKELNPSAGYPDFIKALCVEKHAAWGVIDYEAKKPDGSILNKLVLISWCPDDCGVRVKMLHGSTTNTLKSKLGIDKHIHASTPSDCEESAAKQHVGLK
mmetsp:Transcript_2771/g.3820  ORF Transcript_2771/g.3820 Transcript_2771/m.3820 type:complete len:142 (-) Transcript_2771:94-519(-)|eukprot:CAMPEP_0185253958 /NCGR_PEP_ID=MMETSP1359-20130426/2569_1 /TAXON_ID=552665 /ORGANISM="Bigelowiella longifila, Strain CCMP242" /LENGTH=141 /DNA_ID=CAMNT_0027836481 /DNA_START=143 /DNA_END=568 /DNA_ORIENTATION=-